MYEPTINFIKRLRQKGVKIGCASSSKNCQYILEKTGLIELFDEVLGGQKSKRLNLKGKPNPDIFVVCAKNLGLIPDECLMVEDAMLGVEAGWNGNFAFVVGVTRSGDLETLRAHGADIVVEHMDEVSLQSVEQWFKSDLPQKKWRLEYSGYDS